MNSHHRVITSHVGQRLEFVEGDEATWNPCRERRPFRQVLPKGLSGRRIEDARNTHQVAPSRAHEGPDQLGGVELQALSRDLVLDDLAARRATIVDRLAVIQTRAPLVLDEYHQRLRLREVPHGCQDHRGVGVRERAHVVVDAPGRHVRDRLPAWAHVHAAQLQAKQQGRHVLDVDVGVRDGLDQG